MPSPLRWAARVAPVALAALAAAAHPTWAAALGVDAWNLPALRRQIRTMDDERFRLDAALEATRRRTAVRRAIAAELAAGRVTLAAAGAAFSSPELTSPAQWHDLRNRNPGLTDEELGARTAIAFALEHVPAQERAAAARRWEDEFRRSVAAR